MEKFASSSCSQVGISYINHCRKALQISISQNLKAEDEIPCPDNEIDIRVRGVLLLWSTLSLSDLSL